MRHLSHPSPCPERIIWDPLVVGELEWRRCGDFQHAQGKQRLFVDIFIYKLIKKL